jgi:hypothetical protein
MMRALTPIPTSPLLRTLTLFPPEMKIEGEIYTMSRDDYLNPGVVMVIE